MSPDLVCTNGASFSLSGAPFPIVGANCYFLAYCSDRVQNDLLGAIKAIGANVVRSWAFLNKSGPQPGFCFQSGCDGVITIHEGPDGLGRLDALIAAAEQNEVRLILPLVNYWDALGGMKTYVDWLLPNQQLSAEEFFRNERLKASYKNYISQVMNRRNSITGVPYRNSPAILAWELANEPRCPGPGGRETLLDWIAEMSEFIKRPDNDPNHLLALGDEGFLQHDNPPNHLYTGEYGVDFEATLNIPQIDFGVFHFYPAPAQMNVPLAFGQTWIRDHVAAGERANKPAVMEEYGILLGDYGIDNAAARDEWYARWHQAVYDAGGAGDLIWAVGGRDPEVAGYYDGYMVYSAAEIPSIARHAAAMLSRYRGASMAR